MFRVILGFIFMILALGYIQGKDRLSYRWQWWEELLFFVLFVGAAYLLSASLLDYFI